MKIIIDTDKKELVLIGLVTLDEINTFCRDHNLMGYSISSTDTSTHWYRGWHPSPLDPPYKITSTGGPITVIPGSTCATVSHIDQTLDIPDADETIKFGYQQIDPNKYKPGDYWEKIDGITLARFLKSTIRENDPPDAFQ